MPLFKAPMAFENKNAAFAGSGAFGLPKNTGFDDYETASSSSIRSRQVRKKPVQKVTSMPVLIPPVILPSFYIPSPPIYEEDIMALKKSMGDLEKELAALNLQAKFKIHGDGLLEDWKKTLDQQRASIEIDRESIKKNYATNVRRETSSVRDRIAAIKAARLKEEEEKRKAQLEEARKAAEAEKALREKVQQSLKKGLEKSGPAIPPPASKPIQPVKPVTAAKPPSPPPVEAELAPYELNPEDYEKAPTSNRARAILQEAQRILDSANIIKDSPDPKIKARRLELRMLINRRVGQVANSGTQVFLVIKELLELAAQIWRTEGGDMLNYCAHTMATKFIEQAETQISLHTPSAFPYGQVAADLIGNIPAFKNILMALLIQRCPYIVPRYPPRKPGQSEHEYKLSLGYKDLGGGMTEGESSYTERMCGIISFYAALVQSTPLRPKVVNPYDVKFGWLWVASILNMRPRPITPYVVAAFLEIAGHRMSKVFGENFFSLMEFIQSTFIPMIPSVSIAAKTRLKIFVDGVLEKGRVDEPEGLLIEGVNYSLLEGGQRRLSVQPPHQQQQQQQQQHNHHQHQQKQHDPSLPPMPPHNRGTYDNKPPKPRRR